LKKQIKEGEEEEEEEEEKRFEPTHRLKVTFKKTIIIISFAKPANFFLTVPHKLFLSFYYLI